MEDTGYEALEESDPEQAPGARRAPISRKPSRKDPLRIQVICAAVQEGSLPASALENELRQDSSVDDDDENEGRKGSKDDETIKVQYHYTLLHITFLLATMYVLMQLTHWFGVADLLEPILNYLPAPTSSALFSLITSTSLAKIICEQKSTTNLIEYTDPSASTLRGSIQLKPSNHPPKLALEDAQRTEKNIHALMALFLSPEELENINERKKSIPGIANMSLINDHGFSIHSLSVKGDNNFEVCYKVTWMGRWHSQR
ncbi:hypothetical protein PPACK8108_LOCUS15034 [Phakopsora pachyrhizi]|uniref:Uncharacterized protein n=1 Tax=Phakopsora pachyrhizi TaxID=170000 RepID=A0AAV0B891_PHAPC|nr:hypothetical protein PPACK8108_LOCUS15034 [Phakopsora pachyrhizi]